MIPRFWLKPAQLAAFHAAQTDAHRLCSRPDGWVERLGDDALICYKHENVRDFFLEEFAAWSAETQWTPARVFGKFLPKFNDERIAPVLLQGDATLPMVTTVQENGVRYALDFEAGYSHGLFLDQRGNRAFLRRIAPKKLLNTFAYTCSFSVVVALAGGETVSIDLSKKSLDRGRQNFTLNDLPTDPGHRFLADDVLDVLPRLARRGEKFDAIVLDPPTFSRGNNGRRWQIEQHFEEFLGAALELAAPGARVLISTNCAKLDLPAVERMARYSLKLSRRQGALHREPALPDFPPSHGSTTLWLTLR